MSDLEFIVLNSAISPIVTDNGEQVRYHGNYIVTCTIYTIVVIINVL